MQRRVVVTGLGMVTPLSCDVADCWKRITAGESGISECTVAGADKMRSRIAGHVRDWDPSGYMDRREFNRLDRFTQFAIVAGTVYCKLAKN